MRNFALLLLLLFALGAPTRAQVNPFPKESTPSPAGARPPHDVSFRRSTGRMSQADAACAFGGTF